MVIEGVRHPSLPSSPSTSHPLSFFITTAISTNHHCCFLLYHHHIDHAPPHTPHPTAVLSLHHVSVPRRESEALADKQRARSEFLKKLEQEQQQNAREQAKVRCGCCCCCCYCCCICVCVFGCGLSFLFVLVTSFCWNPCSC